MSQWTPKPRRQSLRRTKTAACRKAPIEVVELQEGFDLAFPEGPQGWMPLALYEKHHRPGMQVQMSACGVTGETWVKRLVGRYRHQEEPSLQQKLRVLEQVAAQQRCNVGFNDGPLWLQVEFLENVIEFHLRPPCGCPPRRASAAA